MDLDRRLFFNTILATILNCYISNPYPNLRIVYNKDGSRTAYIDTSAITANNAEKFVERLIEAFKKSKENKMRLC